MKLSDIPVHVRPLATPPPRTRLARLGDRMARRRGVIAAIQWTVVGVYAFLVIVPALRPLPPEGARILSNLTLFAQFVFWGVWWPFVILSILVLGRLWCGVLCPEGALSEWASRHGRGASIPRWMRWSAWPVVGFLTTTLYGQLISVYEYPRPVLLILGGSTVAAIGVGLGYGKGKRVWCRYLCPVSGVFALLARLSPLHFQTDRAAWTRYPVRTPAIDCAPLLDVKNLRSAARCHQCGRCSGHRDAVRLRLRWPGAEVLESTDEDVGRPEIVLLFYGVLGFAQGAFQWTMAPEFVRFKQALAEWLVAHELFWPLADNAPWWVLTHYPLASDVFSWLDGACIAMFIAGHALLVGGVAQGAVWLAARIARTSWRPLGLGYLPMGALNLYLGLSMLTLTQLRGEGISFGWVSTARIVLLGVGVLSSAVLGGLRLRAARPGWVRGGGAFALYLVPLALVAALWARVFFAA